MAKYLSSKGRATTQANLDSLREQRENTLKWVDSDEPLKAEPEEERKTSYVLQGTGIKDIKKAAKVADYDASGYFGLSGKEIRDIKTITEDKEPDFVDIYFLEVARAAASTVGRVLNSAGDWWGTGFMISDTLFITNNHVIEDLSKANNFLVEFNYELDVLKVPKPITRFALDPKKFFMTSPWPGGLDFTIVAVGDRVLGKNKLSDFGYCPITGDVKNKHALGTLANIIQHPEGDFKQISIRKNLIAARNDDVLQYYTETKVGSSGSPVFNYRWEPIALHHWSEPTQHAYTLKGNPGPTKNTNEGIRISAIVESVNVAKSGLSSKERSLIDKVLKSQFCHPSLLR